MKDTLTKRIELSIRKLLINIIGKIFKRKINTPNNVNCNNAKLLFLRQDLIGDVLVSTPLFATLKKHYPNIKIDVLLGSKNSFVLDNDPAINLKWIYKKNLFYVIMLMRKIRKERYDFAIDLMDNPSATSTFLMLLAGANCNVGIEKENSFAYNITVPLIDKSKYHIVDRLAQLLTVFNINLSDEKLELKYYPKIESLQNAKSFYNDKLKDNFVIACNISAGTDVRFWGIDNFVVLINWILKNHKNTKVLILFKPSDKDRAIAIAKETDAILAPDTSTFDYFASLISLANILITPDTSAVHLASAFKIPAVIMFAPSCEKKLRVWDCYGVDCENIIADTEPISSISTDIVVNAVNKLLIKQKKHSSKII